VKLMFLISGIALLVAGAMMLYRAFAGPTVYDRILSLNALGTKTVVLVCVLGFLSTPAMFLDTAIIYALVNFVATIAILKFIELRRL